MTDRKLCIVHTTAREHSAFGFEEIDAKGRVVGCSVTQWSETVVRLATDEDIATIRSGNRLALGDGMTYEWLDTEKRPVGLTTHHYHGGATRDGDSFGGSTSGYNQPFADIYDRDQTAIAYVAATRKRSAAKAKKAAKA